MKFFRYVFVGIFLINSCYGYSQWIEVNSIPQRSIQVLNFLDDNLGYALMKSELNNVITLEKTTNGGEFWTSLIGLPVQGVEFQDIHFYAEGEGVMLIRDQNLTMNKTRIYQTFDDGESWNDISPPMTETGVGVGQCKFFNQDTGFFVTEKTLYKTQNGGTQWEVIEFDDYLLSLDFINAENGTLGTWDGTFGYEGGMLTTSDGGATWTETLLDENYTSIGKVQCLSNSLSFASPIHGWSAIQASQFYKTIDGGNNWNVISIPDPIENSTLRQVHFNDEMNGVIYVGNHTTSFIYHTTDGGATWEEQETFPSVYDTDMQLTANSGYITGALGIFYKMLGSTVTKELLTDVEVKLFPSPVQSGQAIGWTSSEEFSALSIMSSDGKMIYHQALNQNHTVLPHLNTGLYLIRFWNDKTETTKKLYIE